MADNQYAFNFPGPVYGVVPGDNNQVTINFYSEQRQDQRLISAPQGPPFDLGFLPGPKQLVGRSTDLEWVLTRLRSGQTTAVVALRGMAGIGKTALASEAVRQLYKSKSFPDGIVVILCEGLTDPIEIFKQVLTHLDPYSQLPKANVLAGLVQNALRLLENKKALIVLDNIEPECAIESMVMPLQEAGATLLLTSRQILSDKVIPVEDSYLLGLLDSGAAVELFAQSLGRKDTKKLNPIELTAAERIIQALERHTLAIKLAGRYAADLQLNLRQLADELESPNEALGLPEGETPNAVALAFAKSIETLPAEAKRLFAALAAFPTAEFGKNAALALAQSLGLQALKTSLELLVRRALLDASLNEAIPEEAEQGRLRIHQLLRAYAANYFEQWTEQEQTNARLAIATYYASTTTPRSEALLEVDEGNIVGTLEWAYKQGINELTVGLCLWMHSSWLRRSRTAESLRYLPWGLEGAETLFNSTKQWQNVIYAGFLARAYGNALIVCGRYYEAEQLLLAQLSKHREFEDHLGVQMLLNQLGQIARMQGRMDEAVQYLQQALEITREDRFEKAHIIVELGQIDRLQGRWNSAESHFRQALRIFQRLSSRSGEGSALNELGRLARLRGQLDEAEHYLRQSLDINRELNHRLGESTNLNQLGFVATARNQVNEADGYFQQALVICRETWDRFGEGMSLSGLGEVAVLKGQLDEAEAIFEQALTIDRELQDRQGEGADLTNLACTYMQKGQSDKAYNYFQQSLAIRRELQDPNGEYVTLSLLGALAQSQGKIQQAREYYQQALAIAQALKATHLENQMSAALNDLAQQNKPLQFSTYGNFNTKKESLAFILDAFLNSESLNEKRAVLETAKQHLLSKAADRMLTASIQQIQKNSLAPKAELIVELEIHRTLLRQANKIGIPAAWIRFEAAMRKRRRKH
jgi:tetratricopeptide (TPR) repeat protein